MTYKKKKYLLLSLCYLLLAIGQDKGVVTALVSAIYLSFALID